MKHITLILLILYLPLQGSATQTDYQLESSTNIRLAPGDQKTGYDTKAYQTNSLSLENRAGISKDLVKRAGKLHSGLPPLDMVLDRSVLQLGRKLFFDRRLSRNKTISCAMCHIPEQGFTSNELARPIGFEGRSLRRNAPTILNSVFYQRLFWDARESSLAQQVWSPLLASNEMNNASVGTVIDIISADKHYLALFKKAFDETPNMLNIGTALAQYQASLISANSRFDRWYYDGEKIFSEEEKQGFEIFSGKGRCIQCHHIGKDYALFTDQLLHNTGIGYQDSMLRDSKKVKVQLAPGVVTEVNRSLINAVGEQKPNDLGRYEITLNPQDRWKFRTPNLRNIALTAPYMHNGELSTLTDVIRFYNNGAIANPELSPMLQPLNLDQSEEKALQAFLLTLTGDDVTTLVADAFAAPIGDTDSQTRSQP